MVSAGSRLYHHPQHLIPPYTMCATSVILVVLLGLVIFGAVRATEDYLYYDHEGTDPIVDFVIQDDNPSSPAYPPYLNSTAHGAQVVEFYAPWCPQ